MTGMRDAPWIEETMRTGYCSSGWWNQPPKDGYDPDMDDFWEEGDDGDVFYGSESENF